MLHKLQWEALGGLKILQVTQYFNLIELPLITTSLVLGGGRIVGVPPLFGILMSKLKCNNIKINNFKDI